ncbi:MAG: hypothetical protein IJF09_01935 [Ruminiclostridium sp.]|nr:hypothetical protein [Ruminiclostridium sp.]
MKISPEASLLILSNGKTLSKSSVTLNNNQNVISPNASSTRKRDVFVYSSAERTSTYSVNTGARSDRIAETSIQKRKLPILLACKIAGIDCSNTGVPRINGSADAQAYNNALAEIQGDHTTLEVDASYRYSQTANNAYGLTEPERACAAFALATALSIKNNRQITPEHINTTNEGHLNNVRIDENVDSITWSDGTGSGTAYWITSDSPEETLRGIDAQLYLGNPVLIHTSGTDSNGNASEHWATVIGKDNGEYIIIDPWDGTRRSLDEMEIYGIGYEEDQIGEILDYMIISDRY